MGFGCAWRNVERYGVRVAGDSSAECVRTVKRLALMSGSKRFQERERERERKILLRGDFSLSGG